MHVKKCPVAKQLQRFDEQAYFRKGVNAGSDGEEGEEEEGPDRGGTRIRGVEKKEEERSGCVEAAGRSKRAAVAELSGSAFRELVRRIDDAFQARCGGAELALEDSVCEPDVCSRWSERDRRLPVQEKHAAQQASILGNLEKFGLLHQSPAATTTDPDGCCCFVEFGAGRGYLSHMLCDCYGARTLVMVERRSYKFKADRTLRQRAGVSVARLRVDIADLDVAGVPALQPSLPFVAMSKHLCGAASDLALRCCLRGGQQQQQGGEEQQASSSPAAAAPVLRGLGIATCCHHLCSWRAYVNKRFFVDLGFTPREFGLIAWLTSWGVTPGDAEHGVGPEGEGGGSIGKEQQQTCCSASGGNVDGGPASVGGHTTGVSVRAAKPRLAAEAVECLNPEERRELGLRCRRLIDTGRMQWLSLRGMDAKLVRYVPESVSPENSLLLARRPSWQASACKPVTDPAWSKKSGSPTP